MLGWWIVKTMVFPLVAKVLRYFITTKEVNESRPEVGSSINIKLGSVMSSYAIEVLLFSPPEIPFDIWLPILVFWHFSSLSSSRFSHLSRIPSLPGWLTILDQDWGCRGEVRSQWYVILWANGRKLGAGNKKLSPGLARSRAKICRAWVPPAKKKTSFSDISYDEALYFSAKAFLPYNYPY